MSYFSLPYFVVFCFVIFFCFLFFSFFVILFVVGGSGGGGGGGTRFFYLLWMMMVVAGWCCCYYALVTSSFGLVYKNTQRCVHVPLYICARVCVCVLVGNFSSRAALQVNPMNNFRPCASVK